METTDPKTLPGTDTRVNRRAFIRTTGVAAAMAGGIEGILAARRAPAFAQGTIGGPGHEGRGCREVGGR